MAKRRRQDRSTPATHVDEHGSYGYVIESRPMALLMGKHTRFAKITRVIRYRKGQPPEEVAYPPKALEHYGEDNAEAIAKAEKEVQVWIDQQPKQPDDLR